MTTIWKFPVDITDRQTILVPTGAKFLSVQVQHGIPCIWALVEPDATKVPHKIRIYGTGHPIDQLGQFLGTFQVQGGSLKLTVLGSNDGVHYDRIKRLKAKAGANDVKPLRLPLFIKFRNSKAPFGPVKIIVVNDD